MIRGGEGCSSKIALVLGSFLGLVVIKLGNPIILHSMIDAPEGFWQLVFSPWPVEWLLVILIIIVIGTIADQQGARPSLDILIFSPLLWLLVQWMSLIWTVDRDLSLYTATHFTACVCFFFLGRYAFNRRPCTSYIWSGIIVALFFVILIGWQQHFYGLEQLRSQVYQQENWQSLPPEFLEKIGSSRIFSTFVYPNAYAGALLLFLPSGVWVLWNSKAIPGHAGKFLAALLLVSGGACLAWTRSKSGWLIAMCMLAASGLFFLRIRRKYKILIVALLLTIGGAGFVVRYIDYFKEGATSVGARFDYWKAAGDIVWHRPLTGSGAGTFAIPYAEIKAPESEMTRLVHNDYLEQASDSGIFGFVFYCTWILAAFYSIFKTKDIAGNAYSFCVMLGLTAWFFHGLVEFQLYIPALAWPAFFLLGLMVGPKFMGKVDGQSRSCRHKINT
ncbi:MAG: O-antigen ligase family protein [Verrucomicrobia bacterium]|nr:O-antigen ligase family protein [Verrucomicrobiota bacterium]MCF7707317.1 O-antigen ligase family protein [Verrucomicrobiota bacterium]